jgi:hypothetical protein
MKALGIALNTHREAIRAVVILALIAILVNGSALTTGFTFDDGPDVQNNPAVKSGADVVGIFASPLPPGDLYRPLTVLTFALNERVAPGNALTYHGVNVSLHAAVTILVFFVAIRLFACRRLALIAAALFAVHPVHTEAVTSLVGRAELLAALFGTAAMLSMTGADTTDNRTAKTTLRLLSVLFFCLALLSKESALVFVPLIALFRIACRREPFAAGLAREWRSLDWVPYGLCVSAYLLLRFGVVGSFMVNTVMPVDNVLAFVPWSVRVRSALGVLWDYFGLLNVPMVLSADYSYAQVPIVATWTDPRFLAGMGVVVAAGCVLVRDRRPAVTFAVALPFVALSLTSNVLFPIGTIKAERLLYFPSVGWTLLAAYGLDRLMRMPRYRPVAVALLVVLTAAFAVRTWTRNRDWTNSASLYRSIVRSAPNSAKAHYNLGVAFQLEGNDAAAIAQFRRALEIYPWEGEARSALNIGAIFDKRGRTDEAIEWYRKALDIEPGFGKAHTNLCRALLIEKRFTDAATACRRGLRYDPGDANLLKGLGASLIGAGEVNKGIDVLRRSLARNPGDGALRVHIERLQAAGTDPGESSREEIARVCPAG